MDAWEYEKVHRELAIDLQRRQLEIHIQVSNSGSSVYDESELTDWLTDCEWVQAGKRRRGQISEESAFNCDM